MTTRSLILAAGFIIAAIVCFYPPTKEVVNPLNKYLSPVAVTDYPLLFVRLTGVMCLTVAVWFIAATRRRVIVDATPKERSVV